MIELLELKFSRRWQTNKIESDLSNSPRHSSSRQFRSPRSILHKIKSFEHLKIFDYLNFQVKSENFAESTAFL